MPPIILASSSPYRRELLAKLGLAFTSASPDIDETAEPNEPPETLVRRLALEKALALAESHTDHLIIGSDQVATVDGQILTKPGTFENAAAQLQASSGKTVTFLTGLCLLNSKDQSRQVSCERFEVTFLPLSQSQIEHYLYKEEPYDCAGSFKSEGLGITLFERLAGNDPNTLVGLPLIALCNMLRKSGVEPLSER